MNLSKKYYILLHLFLSMSWCINAQEVKQLNGVWCFSLDQDDLGMNQAWYARELDQLIAVPGTTDEAHYGNQTIGSDYGILTRAYKYYGPAWYQTDIYIPVHWKDKRIFLFLERVMWESRVYLDGKAYKPLDALNSPHNHDLGILHPGKHRLTIRINNNMMYNIGDKGHLYTEYTQSIWNGMVGRIELQARNPTRMGNPQIYTTVAPKTLQITDTLVNEDGLTKELTVALHLSDHKTGELVYSKKKKIRVVGNRFVLDVREKMPDLIKLWDDVTPDLYDLEIKLINKRGLTIDKTELEVGFREIKATKSKILVNGIPVFLRGNLDCVHFPLTGYPAMQIGEWERIFRIYKAYGFNHVRFHSWCPPEAAFRAADRVGLYLQPEVIWLDWWMAVDNPGREEMNTKGRPKGLGYNPSADYFTQKEIAHMLQAYGNHASFTTLAIGNELGNSDFERLESWLKPYQKSDDRRLYSVSSARKITATDQFIVTHYIDKLGNTRGNRGAHTDWDFEDVYSKSGIPVIAHEIGQWPVYPRWEEIKKYTGVLKARNLEGFKERARENNIDTQNEDFVQASGAINQIMYKQEIESFLRTPSAAGIQLLSMQDYQGQGEALVGWLDVFYDSKGITTPEKFRNHHDTTVVLLRVPQFVWKADEQLTAKIQLAHYGRIAFRDGVYWTVKDDLKRVVATGKLNERTFLAGSSEVIGKFEVDLSCINKASKLTIEIGLENRPIKNRWSIWVYPPERESSIPKVFFANRFDAQVEKILEGGGTVLLDASELGTPQTAEVISFYPLYWSLTFFPGQGINTIGMLIRDKHPAFHGFPTDNHSDWQWQAIYKGAKGFYINDFPASYRPMAQPIDDFHRNNKLASIFEMNVGKGKLLVTGFNVQHDDNFVSQHLKASLMAYAASDKFQPKYTREISTLRRMFTYVEPLKSVIPSEFAKSILFIEAGKNAKQTNANADWSATVDLSESRKGTSYSVKTDAVWKDSVSSAWQGKDITLSINVPHGIIASLYVFFPDWDSKGRKADIIFEGRPYALKKHDNGGQWVKLHVMREDSNDGRLKFEAKATDGPNVMISKVALVEESQ